MFPSRQKTKTVENDSCNRNVSIRKLRRISNTTQKIHKERLTVTSRQILPEYYSNKAPYKQRVSLPTLPRASNTETKTFFIIESKKKTTKKVELLSLSFSTSSYVRASYQNSSFLSNAFLILLIHIFLGISLVCFFNILATSTSVSNSVAVSHSFIHSHTIMALSQICVFCPLLCPSNSIAHFSKTSQY